jgi:predicted dehydrogenase
MLAEELAEFGRCLRGEAKPETGAEEGIAALSVVLAALDAHAEAVA